jgi:hypothetical protein
MNIDHDMVRRAMEEMDKRLMRNEWVEACEIARCNIAFEILDAAINGANNDHGTRPAATVPR